MTTLCLIPAVLALFALFVIVSGLRTRSPETGRLDAVGRYEL